MEMSKVSMLIFVLCLLMVASSQAMAVGGSCDLISNELKNNVTRDLYGIEVGLKLLMREELVEVGKEFDQVPMILHDFLSSKYREAERSLESLVHRLSSCLGTNLTSSVYIPEPMIEFSKLAIIKAKKAQTLIHQLIQRKEKNTTADHEQVLESSDPSNEYFDSCLFDGTKCQYLPCALGNKLPICAIGFASGITGGAGGLNYVVTRSDDGHPKNPSPGTLRFGVEITGRNKGGVWIIFKESMEIKLKEKLWINSNTTIDGRGVNVTIIGKGLVLARVENVILHNFEVVSTGQSDTVHVFDGTRRVWIDHLTSRDAHLGLVTVLQGSTDVTISNCYLSNHNYNMLLGASDQDTMDRVLRVTIYRNWFKSSTQRMPHCRWGYCHVVNNYYMDWFYYAIGARVHAKVLSELNVFEPGRRLEVTPWFDQYKSDLTPTIESSKDLLLNGATFHQFLKYGTLSSPRDNFPMYKLPTRPTDSLASLVTNCSGVLFGSKLSDCLATP
ncbi:hypothetical protein HHK36_020650 [Tetracentron sinense]|uniref:Pectate lyase n=1 Tax=Tetracentron sinense TaxID=13715 RepID=A0A835DB85_TETSI|nr:hypothetical protein HHK36_020650 [Tetracentron sinense]